MREHKVAERYLAGSLPEKEVAAFEELLIASEEARSELDLVEMMRESIRDCEHIRPANDAGHVPSRVGMFPFLGSPRYALAASFLLAVFATTTGLLYLKQVAQPLPPPQTNVFALHTLRSSTTGQPDREIFIGRPGEWTVLMLEPGPAFYDRFRVVVTRRDTGDVVFSSDTLTQGFQGLLSVGLPSETLREGDYDVRIEGANGDSSTSTQFTRVSELAFRAVPAATDED